MHDASDWLCVATEGDASTVRVASCGGTTARTGLSVGAIGGDCPKKMASTANSRKSRSSVAIRPLGSRTGGCSAGACVVIRPSLIWSRVRRYHAGVGTQGRGDRGLFVGGLGLQRLRWPERQ